MEVLLSYFKICEDPLKELILKDLLQNLMVDISNLNFYKTSYHLNMILIQAIGKEVHSCGVMGEMAIKVISYIFEQQLRSG